MKWRPHEAIARHALEVVADRRSSEADLLAARRVLADPFGEEALDALDDGELEAMERAVEKQLEASARGGACAVCGARCDACADRAAD